MLGRLRRRTLLGAAGAGLVSKTAAACDPTKQSLLGRLLLPDANACGPSSPVFNGNFTASPQTWMGHSSWINGDQWAYVIPGTPGGATDGANTWWTNPILTPQGAPLYSQSASGLKIGLQVTPNGIGITQPRMGTVINNQSLPGGNQQLFGYYELSASIPVVPGFFLGWDIEDLHHEDPVNFPWTTELDCFIWCDSNSVQNVFFRDGPNNVVLYTGTVSAGNHTYGIDWQSDFIRCYVDGNQVGSSYANPGGDYLTRSMLTYIYTDDAILFQGPQTNPAQLPAFATVQYFDIWHTKPVSGGGSTTGPTATSTFLTADFTSTYFYPTPGTTTQNSGRGQMIISPGLYGVADGAGGNDGSLVGSFSVANGNPFALFTSTEYQTKMATVSPGIWMFVTNPTSPETYNLSSPTVVPTNAFTNLINNFYKVDPLGVSSIIMGLDWLDGNKNQVMTQAQFGQIQHARALYFQNQIMPNGKRLPVIGFTGSNEPGLNTDLNGYYNTLVANVKNVSLPGGGTYKVLAAVADFGNDVPDGMNGFSANVPGIDIFQNDSFYLTSVPGGIPMSALQTAPYNTAMSGDILNMAGAASWAVTYMPSTAFGVAGNMATTGSELAMGDYRGAIWDALQKIQSANNSPVGAYIMKWDSALQGEWGFLLDPGPTSANQISPGGYANGKQVRTMIGPRWNVPTNSAGLLTMACTPSDGHFGLMIVNAGRGAQNSRQVALSHVPTGNGLNPQGTGTANVWQMTSSSTGDGNASTVAVTSGVTAAMNFPDPSITIIYS
jgi:hypothetical protein